MYLHNGSYHGTKEGGYPTLQLHQQPEDLNYTDMPLNKQPYDGITPRADAHAPHTLYPHHNPIPHHAASGTHPAKGMPALNAHVRPFVPSVRGMSNSNVHERGPLSFEDWKQQQEQQHGIPMTVTADSAFTRPSGDDFALSSATSHRPPVVSPFPYFPTRTRSTYPVLSGCHENVAPPNDGNKYSPPASLKRPFPASSS